MLGLFVVLILAGAIYLLLPMFQAKDLAKVASNQLVTKQGATEQGTTEKKPAQGQEEAVEKVPKTEQPEAAPSTKEEPAPATVETKIPPVAVEALKVDVEVPPPHNKPLPPVPQEGSSLRMLALAESSLIIYVDDRKPQQYSLHDGLDLTWNAKTSVKVELAEPAVARFWLGGQELDLEGLKSFQLQSTKPQ